MEKKCKVAILGMGFMGSTHRKAYEQLPQVEIVGILDANNPPSNSSPPIFSRLEELLSFTQPDVVDICLPTPAHYSAALLALEKGCHVIVEKPLARFSSQGKHLLEKAQEKQRRLLVAHVCRFMPEYQILKELLQSQELGKPLHFSAQRLSEPPKWSTNNWLWDKDQSGGTLMDLQIHDIDLALWLFGAVEKSLSTECLNPSMETNTLTHVTTTLYHQGGSVSLLEASHIQPSGYPFTTGFRLIAEKATLEFFRQGSTLRFQLCKGDAVIDLSSKLPAPTPENDPYYLELKSFIHTITTDEKPCIDPWEAYAALELINTLTE